MKVIRNQKLLKTTALFFIINLLSTVVYPTMLWSATTASDDEPQYSGLGTVNADNMVNLATGDLALNVPVLEVPGPEGGFSLSLSYQAGIQPTQDASWVGLGWGMHPGSITRVADVYPDDVNNVITETIDYFESEERSPFSKGLGTKSTHGGSIAYNFFRNYASESGQTNTFGVLHAKELPDTSTSATFDSYALLDPSLENNNGSADKQLGGSFPAYDQYFVTGPGISGSIQPYIFENGRIYRQNLEGWDEQEQETYPIITFKNSNQPFTKKVNFRFKNDFSNAYTLDDPDFPASPSNVSDYLDVYDNQENYDTLGFDTTDYHLAGSKHIEWFTNSEIASGSANSNYGFLPYSVSWNENKYGEFVGDQVGGFMVTDESGKTYHYGLPAYIYNQYSKYEVPNGDAYRENYNEHPYAYTWLLTAITGPDYEDNGNQGPDETDGGYWVKFEYGMWTDNYKWRTPGEGKNTDIDRKYKFFSSGYKETYYLDAIKTRSHTALFIKEERHDAKGIANTFAGGYTPYQEELKAYTYIDESDEYDIVDITFLNNGDEYVYNFPATSLKLNHICLLKNEILDEYIAQNTQGTALNDLREVGDELIQSHNYTGQFKVTYNDPPGTSEFNTYTSRTRNIHHYGDNVIDISDFGSINGVEAISLRVVDFETGYQLCDATSNSFYDANLYAKYPTTSPTKNGKLTLKTLRFRGIGGKKVIPPMHFSYSSNNPDYNKDKYDNWGFYKCDYESQGISENIERMTSKASADSLDAWCLTQIHTSLGAKIDIHYEPDEYDNVALLLNSNLKVESVEPIDTSDTDVKLSFYDAIDFTKATQLDSGDVLQFKGLVRHKGEDPDSICEVLGQTLDTVYHWNDFKYAVRIKDIDTTHLIVESINDSTRLYQEFTETYGVDQSYNCSSLEIDTSAAGGPYDFITSPEFVGGNLVFNRNVSLYGGGLRVGRIDIDDGEKVYSTLYHYEEGTTSYEPVGMDQSIFNELPAYIDWVLKNKQEALIKEYEHELYGNFSNLIAVAREVPLPSVFYKNVEVRKSVGNKVTNGETLIEGYKRYDFEVFNGVYPMETIERDIANDTTYSGTSIREIRFRDYSSRVGILKASYIYDRNDSLHAKVTYTYLHDLDTTNTAFRDSLDNGYANQGRIDQRFHEYRYVKDKGDHLVISKREEYPVVMISQKTEDFKTGITSESYNLAFDFFTGMPVKVFNTDAYDNHFITETTPAYKQYNSMGLKIFTAPNKHMLSQGAASYTYKVVANDYDNKTGLVSASVQTWSNQVPVVGEGTQTSIWRPYRSYSWIGADTTALQKDGTHNMTIFNADTFDYWNYNETPQAGFWQINNENMLYDIWNHALEIQDVNSNFDSERISNDRKQVIAAATFAKREEMAYSGAEGFGLSNKEGGVTLTLDGSTPVNSFAHTGQYSVKVDPGDFGYYYEFTPDTNRVYHASVWVYMPGAAEEDLNNVYLEAGIVSSHTFFTLNPVIERKAGEWYLLTAEIEPDAAGDIFIRTYCHPDAPRPVYFDDFRVCPIDAGMTSYVYDHETGQLEYKLDNDNLYTRYEYDAAGRLVATYQEIFYPVEKRISKQVYHFERSLE